MKIKKNIIKAMCAALVCTTIMNNLISVYATETIITESPMDESSGTGSSDSSWTTEENSFEDIKVTYQQSLSYTVTIPKTIALDTNKQAAYSVKVSGNIDANQRVYVAPVDGIADSENLDFYMNDLSGKNANVVATVTQNKTCWNSEDVANGYEETNNSVSAPNLTAGTWEGTFQVEIRLETEKAHEHNYVDGKCECGEIDPNHEHNYVDGTCTICGKGDSYDIAPAEAYSDWNYTLDEENKVITLNYYKGSKTDVIVYANYEINGVTYKAQLKNSTYSSNLASYPTNYIFANKTNVKTIKFSDSFDTSNLTNMSHMFHACSNVTSIDFGNNFDTRNVTDMSYTFANCSALTNLNISSFDTSNVTDMYYMFGQCYAMTNLDLSNFNTSNVTNMGIMFYMCQSLTSLDLSNFDTSNVINMYQMFRQCSSLAELDLSSFDTSKATNMDSMFYFCANLKTIYVTDGKWSTSKATTKSMFDNCGTKSVTYVE